MKKSIFQYFTLSPISIKGSHDNFKSLKMEKKFVS